MSTLDVSPHVLTDLVTYQLGSIVSRMLLKASGGNVTLFAFSKGEELSTHTTPHDALLSVVEGVAKVTVDATAYQLEAGEVIPLPAGVPHAVHAVEDFKMLLVLLKVPIVA